MPGSLEGVVQRVRLSYDHTSPTMVIVGLVISLFMVIVGVVGVRVAVIRTPADHFVRPPERRPLRSRIVRTSVGVLFVACGIAMLVLPGQGVLTILIGLLLLDLPIQRRVALWLVARPKVREVIDGWRVKAGQRPFELPHEPTHGVRP